MYSNIKLFPIMQIIAQTLINGNSMNQLTMQQQLLLK
jgi:hypothetical protein